MSDKTKEFFEFAQERHNIYLRRFCHAPNPYGEGPNGGPWTDDPILQEYRFTNVYRELDKTTIWFRNNIREPFRDKKDVLLATIAFRWFNRISTGRILDDQMMFSYWDSDEARKLLQGISPVVTAAYIIKTPNGMNKLDGVLWCIDQCADDIGRMYREMCESNSLERSWEILKEMPFMGPFMAYEVITDLRHTHILENATDIMTWANPGPGCRRGISRLLGLDKDYFRSGKTDEIMSHMQLLLAQSQDYIPDMPPWEMREVEHTLCEFDKYLRAKSGDGRPKQKFP
jgi:hypothetical protein